MGITARALLVLGSLMLLSACLLTPGKFESTLDIRGDRSFTFTYKGEVIATDLSDIGKGLENSDDEDATPTEEDSAVVQNIAWQDAADKDKAEEDFSDKHDDTKKATDNRVKMEAVAAALRKEKGFRSATYLGDNKFMIDYAITSQLTHGFVFPFNSDAEIMFPFLVIELRGDDRVRIKAPGYANGSEKKRSSSMGGGSGADAAGKQLDGRFTLTTDATIIAQNQEDGPTTVAGKQQLVWTVNPLTSEAPMAVIRFPAAR